MDDENLSGLDLDAAREYILAYAVDAKRLEKTIADQRTELERWRARVALAEGRLASAGPAGDPGIASLAQAAAAKAEEAGAKLAALEAESGELRAKIERMRVQLPLIKARERSIDPDRLLAELQLMTGELLGEASGADFAKLEADAKAQADLEALKRRAGDGERS